MDDSYLTAGCDRLIRNLSSLEKTFVEYGDLIAQDNSEVRDIREIEQSLKAYSRDLLEENRLLRLGVIGQIKSGKSSLLNLLLFDGKEVLPKASTPMTASLTHIVKCDRDEIEVEYYNHKDWQEIRRHAREYKKQKDTSKPAEFMKASLELVEMAEARRIRVDLHLGKKEVLPTSVDEMNGRLRQLVGSEGKMTPLVKSVTIRCGQGLPDVDVADTPGINDPIVSRCRETDNLLKQADAVLLLSSAPQFMDSTDAEFFHKRVPAEGISRRLLIGSKFDSALVDVWMDHAGDLQGAKDSTKNKLVNQARKKTNPDQDGGEDGSLAIEKDHIVFVSAMCAILAAKPVAEWNEEEQAILANLHKRYPDWIDLPIEGTLDENTRATLAALGNREKIDECLAAIRTDKDRIIQGKMQNFLREKRGRAEEELKELIEELDERREHLGETDLIKIKKQREEVAEEVEDIREKVVDKWEELIDERTKTFRDLKEKIYEEAEEARRIISCPPDEVPIEIEKERKGPLAWVARILWDGGKEVKTSYEQILNTAEIEDGILTMEEELKEKIRRVFETVFDFYFIKKSKNSMHALLAEELGNVVAHTINPTQIQRSIRNAINEVAKKGRKELRDLNDGIQDTFHGYEINDAKSVIREQRKAREIVRSLSKQCTNWVDQANQKVDIVTARAKEALVPAAVQALEDYLDSIEKDLESREFKLQRYELAIEGLKKHQSKLGREPSERGGGEESGRER